MKRLIPKIIIFCFVCIGVSSCYGKYIADRIDYYNSQEHDLDLIGIWERYENLEIRYREYRDDGKVYYHTKNADGTMYSETKSFEYWYTKDGKQYSMTTRGESMKPYEDSWTYSFSEDKTLLYLASSSLYWTRTTLPD